MCLERSEREFLGADGFMELDPLVRLPPQIAGILRRRAK
jgi:hypothetical protein